MAKCRRGGNGKRSDLFLPQPQLLQVDQLAQLKRHCPDSIGAEFQQSELLEMENSFNVANLVTREVQSLQVLELARTEGLATPDLVERQVEVRQLGEVADVIDFLEQILVQLQVLEVDIAVEVLDLLYAARDQRQILQVDATLQVFELLDTPALDDELGILRLVGVVDADPVERRAMVLLRGRQRHPGPSLAGTPACLVGRGRWGRLVVALLVD
mmetsp:Transcript_44596/g.142149  ORF Transcript_44596/g.142149 Transcript_44596/m.142149 type:complete len:214 (-) Transcript_44596:101-742(-)